MRNRRNLTVAAVRRSAVFQPLAVVMAVLILPWLSWIEGGAGARSFQASAATPPVISSFFVNPANIGIGSSAALFWDTTGATSVSISGGVGSVAASGFTSVTPGGTTTYTLTASNASGVVTAQATVNVSGLGGCAATGNTIIRNYCANGVVYATDLTQFETDSVSAYLALHNIPQSDAHVIYDYGRSDLRSAVRGVMMTTLQGIFALPASQRTPHQQKLYDWMQGLVRNNEISLYQNALSSFRSWQADPCHLTLDSSIASLYKLTYDGNPYCFATMTDVVGAPVPAESYFTAYGLKKSYAAPTDTYPEFSKLVAAMGVNVGEVAGIATAAVEVLAGAAATVGTTVFAVFSLAVGVYIVTGGGVAGLALGPAIVAGAAGLTGAATAGAVLVPLLALIIGIAAAVELFTNLEQINTINTNLTNGLNKANALPDLNAMATDSSGLGFYKLELVLASQTVPEAASTAPLPAHQSGDLNFAIGPNLSPTLSYKDWDGNTQSAQTWGGWFVQTCANGAGSTCDQPNSIIASLRYKDWSGVKWTASRMGSSFVSVKASPATTDIACPADSVTLVTPAPDPSKCLSYVSTSIPLEDGSGNFVKASLSVLSPPVFTSSSSFAFGPSIPSTVTISATGNPTPSICVVSSSLPAANFTLNGGVCGNGSFQLAFNGDPSATQGNFPLLLKASNSAGSVQQTINVNVSPQLAIVSPPSVNVTAGIPVNFTVVATGNPAPALSMDPLLFLGGLTFTDNHNGTATIGGIYSSTVSLTCEKITPPGPCGIIATSSQGTIEQQFAINLSLPPQAVIPGCTPYAGDPGLNTCPGATFYANAPNQVLVTTTGATTPVTSWDLSGWIPGVVPSWLSVQNNGNGTALIKGTPPPGTTGTFSILLSPTASYTNPKGHIYPVTVVNAPIFTTPSTGVFTAGTAGSLPISANIGTISLSSALPKGLSFVSNGSTATISGVPAQGTGGQYSISLKDDAGTAGTATQTLTLNVNERPQITSRNTVNMFVGMPGSFAVTTTGFPSVSTHVIPPNPLPATDPAKGDGMYFTVSGLPSTLRVSNLNAQGFATGTLTIQGTPLAGDVGAHQVIITAQNGVGPTAQQALTLNIVTITGPAPASGSTCNGNYNGTFNGNLIVSAGQNCAFFGGNIRGNVNVNGGQVSLTNTSVSGNLAIQGATGFSIGAGTSISGSLTIGNIASGSTANQICGAKVDGNLNVSGNATPVDIGSTGSACVGNLFGNNVTLDSNSGAVKIYNNVVQKNLTCTGNAAITGGGNSAAKKSGQCAAF